MNTMTLVGRVAPLFFLAGTAMAQTTLFYSDTTAARGFGASAAILSDIDGNGLRDFVVGAPGDGNTASPSGEVYVISAESTTSPPARIAPRITAFQVGLPSSGVQLGLALANVGDVNNDGRDDFAVSAPRITNAPGLRGEVYIISIRQTGSTNFTFVERTITGPDTFGTSMVMVDTPVGRRLAIGVPGVNEVRLYDPATGGLYRTLNSGGRLGFLGFSLAAGPSNNPPGGNPTMSILAAGAPNYNNGTSFGEGYVAIYNLANTFSNAPTSFLYRGVAFEQLGTAVASVGFLPAPLGVNSPLSDFAVLGRGSTSSIVAVFHTLNSPIVGTTPTFGTVPLPGSAVVTDGKMAAYGDLDSDGLGEFAVAVAGTCRVFSTANNTLTQIHTEGASTNPGLASGPDIKRMNAVDVMLGTPAFTPQTGGTIKALRMAASTLLPNPTSSLIPSLRALNRPILVPFVSASYDFRITGPSNHAVLLLGSLAPVTPTLFQLPSTFAYVNPANAATLGISLSMPANFSVSLPSNPTFPFLFDAIVYQAVSIDSSNTLRASNGVLGRLCTN